MDLNKIMEIQMMLFGEKKIIFLDKIQNIDKRNAVSARDSGRG